MTKPGPKPQEKKPKICVICNICFQCPKGYSPKRWRMRVTCSTICQGKLLSRKYTGNKHGPMSNKQKQKLSLSLSNTYSKDPRFGSRANNWQGGITVLSKQIRKSGGYLLWKERCLLRDSYSCRSCSSSEILRVHHITELSKIIKKEKIKKVSDIKNNSLIYNPNNGVTFCRFCHSLFHNRFTL